MKISKQLALMVHQKISEMVDEHKKVVDAEFRSDRISHESWRVIHQSACHLACFLPEAIVAEFGQYRRATRGGPAICAYCGKVLDRSADVVIAHMEQCEKHLMFPLMKEHEELRLKIEEARAMATETGEAWEQLAACWPTIQVDCNNQIEAAQFIVSEYEKLLAEVIELRASRKEVK